MEDIENTSTENPSPDLSALESALENSRKEIESLKKLNTAYTKGLLSDEAEYAVFKAEKLTSDTLSFEEALNQVIEKSGFLTQRDTIKTGIRQSESTQKTGPEEEIARLLGVKL